jgi:hypothetical protein
MVEGKTWNITAGKGEKTAEYFESKPQTRVFGVISYAPREDELHTPLVSAKKQCIYQHHTKQHRVK